MTELWFQMRQGNWRESNNRSKRQEKRLINNQKFLQVRLDGQNLKDL
ncbi:hypothetical protein LWHH1689_0739 [Limosilactobacillus reuteri]|uniref:Uncharacterized protein n=1 Tax=Limosilactobacillus reuteri TaxID=1598 RepID=A0A2S1EQ11_LIMRT|nr:hypothetical protein LWHH1689_0739 [Limosilactobacillus reuteri]